MRRAVVVAGVLLLGTVAYAEVSVIGGKGFREFDPSGFPPGKKLSYKTMKARCTKCHNLDRVVQAIQSGIAPISWQPFDQNSAASYGARLMQKANKDMSDEEVRSVVDLMQWLIATEREKYLPRDEN